MVLLAPCDLELFQRAGMAAFAAPGVVEIRGVALWLTGEDGLSVDLAHDGMLVCPQAPVAGGVALSAPGAAALREVMAHEAFVGGFGHLPFVRIDAGAKPEVAGGAALAGWISQVLLGKLREQAVELAGLHEELAALRRGHVELMERFATVEAFVSGYQYSSVLAFTNEVDGQSRTGTSAGLRPGDVVEQRLPVSSAGLAGFELYVPPRGPEDARGGLRVELLTLENDAVVGTWFVDEAGVKPGWAGFLLERGLHGPGMTPVLRIGGGAGQGVPDLGLGVPNPIAEACLSVVGGGPLIRPLAMKIWAGLPGIQPPLLSNVVLPAARAGRRAVLVPKEAYRAAEETNRDPAREGFDLVAVVQEGRELQVHPLEGRLTIARLAGVLPREACFVFATLRSAHESAPPMEVACVCAASREEALAQLAGEQPADGYSGWMRLERQVARRVHLTCRAAAVAPRDCYVATRLPPDIAAAYAWARLVDIGFELLEA